MTQYDGIAVVTESRVALLKKRGLSKLTADMPLLTIESVDVDGEGAVTLTGQSSRGCRQSNLVQIAMARIWQMAR